MSRDVPYDEDEICDQCGKQGGYDFMGDILCPECASKVIPTEPCNRCGHEVCICGI